MTFFEYKTFENYISNFKATFVLKKKASSFKFKMVADKELSIAVEQFDVLYDKNHPDLKFSNKPIMNQA